MFSNGLSVSCKHARDGDRKFIFIYFLCLDKSITFTYPYIYILYIYWNKMMSGVYVDEREGGAWIEHYKSIINRYNKMEGGPLAIEVFG